MAEVRFDAAPEEVFAEDSDATGIFGRTAAWLRELGSGPMGLKPVVGFAAAVLVIAAVAGFAIGGGIGGDSEGGNVSTVVYGRPPAVTAKVVSKDDGGTLHLANVKRLPERPRARGLGAARWRSRTGARRCSCPTARARRAPNSPTWKASK